MADMTVKDISNDPADYITGPVRGEANRTHGGTTQDGNVAVVTVEGREESGGR